ncbi:hypothetical protein [Caloranaerobacter ferrireducens]|uniref:hypothetical protein n=1 Tax=Caloranaerobacter ferrireducens TaxID=1323370 RepID=UPI00159F0F11|nr:hypothetical protein [Caloranaerobacter ferrireducens]
MIILQLISCQNKNILKQQNDIEQKQNNIDNDDNEITNSEKFQELKKLLPERENYRWVYSGFAEYGHQMVLKDIINLNNKIIYSVKGNVFDVSNGEAKGNFGLEIIYTIEEGKLIQRKTGEKIMDSIFNELILIKTPLEKGNEWNQKLKDKEGNLHHLKCYIENINEEKGVKTYSVIYKDLDSNYYEKREIQEGVGIVTFERPYNQNEDSFTIGYSLYKKASGYVNYLEMKKYLPPLEKILIYHGLAEYGHSGVLRKVSEDAEKAVYEFSGSFEDGTGLGGQFRVSYIFNFQDGTITEKVTENTRTNKRTVNSILKDLIILKLPIETGNRWTQPVEINGKIYRMEARIISISYENQPYYPIEKIDMNNPTVKVRYIVKGIKGYFNNTYIEERKFQLGRGMIAFSNLMKGDLRLSGKELDDIYKVNREISNNMFGYSLSFIE